MAEKNNSNKMLTIGLVIIIAIAAIVVIYVNLPEEDKADDQITDDQTEDETENNESNIPETLLTVSYNNTKYKVNADKIQEKAPINTFHLRFNVRSIILWSFSINISCVIARTINRFASKPTKCSTPTHNFTKEWFHKSIIEPMIVIKNHDPVAISPRTALALSNCL